MTDEGIYYWHVHHKELMGLISSEGVEARIEYIKENKPDVEVPIRLKWMTKVSDQEAMASARKAFDEAMASARKVYKEAVVSASKAYNEAKAPGRKAYDEAVVSASIAYNEAVASAWKAYDEVKAPASKAYNEAKAPASKAYNEAVEALHAKDHPGCPWDGRTIFPEKKWRLRLR